MKIIGSNGKYTRIDVTETQLEIIRKAVGEFLVRENDKFSEEVSHIEAITMNSVLRTHHEKKLERVMKENLDMSNEVELILSAIKEDKNG